MAQGTALDASRCPLCGEPNDCVMARGEEPTGRAEGTPCWCVGQVFPAALLDRLAAEDRDRRCVCRVCLEQHKNA